MILRRITEHVKAQNWTAVGLDFVIVVVGVFIGIQVSNWNDARHERSTEALILSRLSEEIPALMAMRAEDREFAILRRDGLETAVTKLYTEGNSESLSDRECLSLALSHIYSIPPDSLPVIAELQSTGRMDAIRNDEVRSALSRFILARDRGRVTQAAVSNDIRQLSLEFPALISARYRVPEDDGELRSQTACDTDAMRADTAFLNSLVSNHQRFLIYFPAVFEPVDTELEALRSTLDAMHRKRR